MAVEGLGCTPSGITIRASDKPVEEKSTEVGKMRDASAYEGAAVDRVKSESYDLDAEVCAEPDHEHSEDDTPLIILKNKEFDTETSTCEPVLEAEGQRNDHIDTLKLAIVKLERLDDKGSRLYKFYEKYTKAHIDKKCIKIHSFDDNNLEYSDDEFADIKDDLKAYSDDKSSTNVKLDVDSGLKLAVVKLERIDDKANHLYKLFRKYNTKDVKNMIFVDSTTKTESMKRDTSYSVDYRTLQGHEDVKVSDVKHNSSADNDNRHQCDDCGVTYKHKNSLLGHKRTPCFGKRPRARLPPVTKTTYQCAVCHEKFHNRTIFKKHSRSHTGSKRYQCGMCDKGYNYKVGWINHMRIHTGERPYSCDQCDKQFRDKSTLMVHKNTHINERIYQCDVCNKTFVTKMRLRIHLRNVHYSTVPTHQCKVCKKYFKIKKSLDSHMNIHSGKYQCSVCKKCLSSKAQLQAHMNIHNDVNPYQCTMCEKVFRRDNCLKRHIMKAHTDERPYQCSHCDKGFVTSGNLTQHMRMHTGERPYKCDVCSKYTSYKHDHSDEAQKLHQCNVCKRYYKRRSLKSHMRMMHSEHVYQCDVCKKGFSSNYQFIVHTRKHTGEKPFECDVCKKAFIEKKNLRKHMHIHIGDMSVECHICKKKISTLEQLKIHNMRIHNDIKPYQCEVCNQTFRYKLNLDRHICERNKDKLYECKICNKLFNNMHVFKYHGLKHTGEKPYQCDLCKKSFALRISMINHLRTHANNVK